MIELSRRSFLKGLGLAVAAPAIVKAENLMKLWVPPAPAGFTEEGGLLVPYEFRIQLFGHDPSRAIVFQVNPNDLEATRGHLVARDRVDAMVKQLSPHNPNPKVHWPPPKIVVKDRWARLAEGDE